MTPTQPLIRRAIWALAGLVAFGVAFELTARLEDLIRYGMPLASPYGSEVDLVTRDSERPIELRVAGRLLVASERGVLAAGFDSLEREQGRELDDHH